MGIGLTNNDDSGCQILTDFPTQMRIAPTAVSQSGTGGDYEVRTTSSTTCTGVPVFLEATAWLARTNFVAASHGYGTGVVLWGKTKTTDAYLGWSAEL